MVLRNGTLKEMIKQITNHKLVLYGYGAKAREICWRFIEDDCYIEIESIIDNCKEMQGTNTLIHNKNVPIISKNEFLSNYAIKENVTVLFTMDNFWEAYEELEQEPICDKVSCYIYKLICREEWMWDMYNADIPQEIFQKEGKLQIPKKIHYCWFGNSALPPLALKCMESWRKFCPDYEIIRWDESNYDVTKNKYMYEAYKEKKWAYVSDYARIDIINQYGGIYLDTDVELIRSIDCLLNQKAFAGFQHEFQVNFGLGYGSVAHNPLLESILQLYEELEWDGGVIPCPEYQTKVLKEYGLIPHNQFQTLEHITILPVRCLCGKSYTTQRERRYENTFSMHHFAGSWVDVSEERGKIQKLWKSAEYESVID